MNFEMEIFKNSQNTPYKTMKFIMNLHNAERNKKKYSKALIFKRKG